MKKNILFSFLLIALFACDETGLTIQIPATGTFDFNINSATANASTNNSFTDEKAIDPTTLVNEASESIKSISLTKFTYEISGYTSASSTPVLMNLSLSTRIDGTVTEILSVTGVTLSNGIITAYEKGNTGSALSAAQVASVEAILDNQAPFDLIITAGFDRNIASDFNINVVWDIIASVSQPGE
jgi:hypothetical protein